MAGLQNKVVIGALLHDIGKVLYRAADGRNHSRRGYEFLKDEVGLHDHDILDQVLYHHASLLKGSDVQNSSPAYITYMADNIAAAADRRSKDTEDTGFDKHVALESIFNIMNGNHGKMHYPQGTLEDDGSVRVPVAGEVRYDESFYTGIRKHLGEVLAALKDDKDIKESYINSLLGALEADLSYIPSSTDKGQLGDVSLYDHVKITAALAGWTYAWTEDNGITDYKTLLFDNSKEFYGKKVFRLYSMDMSGIQDFIYHQFGTEDVLKNLRARSFYLEILLENLIDVLVAKMGLSRTNLIYSGGGHAWLLLPNTEKAVSQIREFEEETNAWLLETFGTELYMAAGSAPCSAHELENNPKGSYRQLFRSVSRAVSQNKLRRYSAGQICLLNGMAGDEVSVSGTVGGMGNGEAGASGVVGITVSDEANSSDVVRIRSKSSDGTRECRICHRSDHLTGDNICSICDGLIKLSRAVLTSKFYAVTSEAGEGRLPVASGEYLLPIGEKELRRMIAEDPRYIRSYSKNKAYTGQSFATKLWVGDYSSAQTLKELVDAGSGIKRLGVIRADVDNLGSAFVSGFPEEYQTLSRSAAFSRMLSLFFKKNVNDILRSPEFFMGEKAEKRNATIVYAGGDDLFIIGAWKDIIEFSVDLRGRLKAFTEDTLKISAGIGLYYEKYPVSYIAAKSGELESCSKGMEGKNAVTLFTAGISVGDATDSGSMESGSVAGGSTDDHTYHWEEFTGKVLGEKLSLLRRFFEYKGESMERGKNFVYRILELYRYSGEKINLARLAYLLARLEPAGDAPQEYRELYDELKHKLYEWHRNAADRKQFITAVYIYIYMIRDREAE